MSAKESMPEVPYETIAADRAVCLQLAVLAATDGRIVLTHAVASVAAPYYHELLHYG